MRNKIRNTGDAIIAFILFCLIGLLTAFSADAKEGAKSGIELCENVIIPSLLPVLILCSIITRSRLSSVFEKLFGAFFEKVFDLPKISASAIILGLIGGYPSGAILTCALYEAGGIDESQAERIMKFNFCSGVAFTVTALGSVTYGSLKTGLVLYFISVISSLIIAFISQFPRSRKRAEITVIPSYSDLSDALCDGVESTVKALAIMSAYIIIFSSIFGIFNPPEYLVPLLEITNGVCSENLIPPAFTSFFLSFGGVCIHFQLFGFLRRMKVKYRKFLLSRMEGAVISFFLYRLYGVLFPEADLVFSNVSSPVHSFSSGGITLSVLMIIGCAVVIFDIENRKLKLHSLL